MTKNTVFGFESAKILNFWPEQDPDSEFVFLNKILPPVFWIPGICYTDFKNGFRPQLTYVCRDLQYILENEGWISAGAIWGKKYKKGKRKLMPLRGKV